MDKWSSWPWEKKAVVIALVVLGFLIFIGFMESAQALELNSAWWARQEGITSTTPQKIYVAAADSTNHRDLPTAYLIWEKSGNPIKIRRFYDNVAESVWIDIPEGQSLVIPAPPPFKRTGSTAWWHKMAFIGAAGDTIDYLPLNK